MRVLTLDPGGRTLSRAGLLTAASFGGVFLAFGIHLPFWPIWLSDHGLSPESIGSFTALSIVVRMVAGFMIPVAAERMGEPRRVLALLLLAAAVSFSAFSLAEGPAMLLVLTLITALAFAGIVPLVEALGVAAARLHGFPYAGPRGLGSLAFLCASLGGGVLVGIWGSGIALWLITGAFLLAAPFALLHPGDGGAATSPRPPGRAVASLARDPAFLLLAASAALVQGSHAVLYVLGAVHWRSLGLADATIGALWAVSVGAEVVLMVLYGAKLTRWLGPVGALTVAGCISLARWLIMCFDPVGFWLWPLQAGHCLSFALGHLGTMAFFERAVPPALGASAQGIAVQLLGGIVMASAMFAAGYAYPAIGGGVYLISAALAAAGIGFALALGRVWSGQRLSVPGLA